MNINVTVFSVNQKTDSNWKAVGNIHFCGLIIKFWLKTGQFGDFLELGQSAKDKNGKWWPGVRFDKEDPTVSEAFMDAVNKAVAEFKPKDKKAPAKEEAQPELKLVNDIL